MFFFLSFFFFLNLREENEHPVRAAGVWSTDLAENCEFPGNSARITSLFDICDTEVHTPGRVEPAAHTLWD